MRKRSETRQSIIETYDFITTYIVANGWAPSVREVAEAMGLVSPEAANIRIHWLVELGLLEVDPGKPRCMRVVAAETFMPIEPDWSEMDWSALSPARKRSES